jgi:hypothetical protein
VLDENITVLSLRASESVEYGQLVILSINCVSFGTEQAVSTIEIWRQFKHLEGGKEVSTIKIWR